MGEMLMVFILPHPWVLSPLQHRDLALPLTRPPPLLLSFSLAFIDSSDSIIIRNEGMHF